MEANNGVAGMDRAGVGDEERGQCESVYPSREEKEMICTLTPSFPNTRKGWVEIPLRTRADDYNPVPLAPIW